MIDKEIGDLSDLDIDPGYAIKAPQIPTADDQTIVVPKEPLLDMDGILKKWKAEALKHSVSRDNWINTAFKVEVEITRVTEQKLCVEFTKLEGNKLAYLNFYQYLVEGALLHAVDEVFC